MKQPKTAMKRIAALLFAGFFLVTACKKEEIQGPQGDPGTPGKGGNSNISSSGVFSIANADWVVDSLSESLKASIASTLITQDVVDKGAVKVYKQIGAAWYELPYDEGDLFTQFGFQVGMLHLNYINIEGGFPSAPATANYRLVVLTQSAKPSKPNQELGMGREEVKSLGGSQFRN